MGNQKGWYDLSGMIRRLFLAWLIAGTVMYLQLSEEQRKLDELTGLQAMSFFRLILIMLVVFFGLNLLSCARMIDIRKWERYGIFLVYIILMIFALKTSFSVSFLCSLILIGAILFVYALYGFYKEPVRKESLKKHIFKKNGMAVWIVGGFAFLFFGFVSIWTVCRVLSYSAPTFDFGIFSQMFYYMKKTGVPYTTLERDGLLSHFCVHVSPIYYLLLPFYCIYPAPVTLQILQAAVLALAVVPFWKLVRRYGCTSFETVLFCLLLFLYPSYSGGTSYDLHENVFLAPLLFWLFYAIDCQNRWGCIVFGILTCMVKEDAAVYVAVIGLWLIFRSLLRRKNDLRYEMVTGGQLFFGLIIWFLLVTQYLTRYGDGVMTYRYQNFMYDSSSSLFTVVKAVFLLPVKVVYECVEQEKIPFLALSMLPLCGMPLITRKYERFILLIPYVLVNLMSDYRYQHDIFFQYTYGSTVCLFYLAMINYVDFAAGVRNAFLNRLQNFQWALWILYVPLVLAVGISGWCFGKVVVPKAVHYGITCQEQWEDFRERDEMLERIPKEASVAATAFYTVALSNRDILYDVQYSSLEHLLSTEYMVLDVTDRGSYAEYGTGYHDGYEKFLFLLEENGYRMVAELEERVRIYRKEVVDR